MLNVIGFSVIAAVASFYKVKSFSLRKAAAGDYKKVSVFQYTYTDPNTKQVTSHYTPVVTGRFGFKFGIDLDCNLITSTHNRQYYTNIDKCLRHLDDFIESAKDKTDLKFKQEIKYNV